MNAERIFSTLLYVYPEDFRREFGAEMGEAFRELQGRGRREHAIAFWLFILNDLLRSAIHQHLTRFRLAPRQVLNVIVMSATVVLVLVCGANVISWSLSYFYHPYLEGFAIAGWMYGAALGLGLGLAQSARLEHRAQRRAPLILATTLAAAVGMEIAVALGRPVLYGTVLGTVVSVAQWLVLRARTPQAGWWVLSTITAVALGIGVSTAAIQTTLTGMQPLSSKPSSIDVSPFGALVAIVGNASLQRPTGSHPGVTVAVTAACGLLSMALTTRLLSRVSARGQSC